MLRSAALVFSVLALAGCAGSRPAAVASPSAAAPAALVAWGDALAVAAGDSVRVVERGRVSRAFAFPAEVLGLDAGGRGRPDTLWVATRAGLFAVAPRAAAAVPVRVPAAPTAPVLAVTADGDGRVWVSTARNGAHVRGADGRWRVVSQAAPVTGVVVQRGERVWLGSHQGVTRQAPEGLAHFTEEGTTEHGLYDNVVDRLAETADGVVWAFHPEGVSVFTDGEPHGFGFVGRRGTALLDVAALPGGGYVLATGAGVLYVGALSDRPEGFYEVYHDSGAGARLAAAAAPPPTLAGALPTRVAVDPAGARVWFASRRGLWSVPVARLRASVSDGDGA